MDTLWCVDKRQYNVELGARLRQARLDAGMTMQQAASILAKREGSDEEAYPSRIGNYEHGRNMPDAFTLHLLVEIYDCDPAWLHAGLQDGRLSQITTIYRKTDERGRDSMFSNARAQPVESPGPAKRRDSA